MRVRRDDSRANDDRPLNRAFFLRFQSVAAFSRIRCGHPFASAKAAPSPILPEVFTAADIALAAGVGEAEVLALIEAAPATPFRRSRRPSSPAWMLCARAGLAEASRSRWHGRWQAPALSAHGLGLGTARSRGGGVAISTLVTRIIAAFVVATTLASPDRAERQERAALSSACYLACRARLWMWRRCPQHPTPRRSAAEGRQSLAAPCCPSPPPRPEPPAPQPPLPNLPVALPPVSSHRRDGPAYDRIARVCRETAPPSGSRGRAAGRRPLVKAPCRRVRGSALRGFRRRQRRGPFRPAAVFHRHRCCGSKRIHGGPQARRRGRRGDGIVVRRDGSVGEVRLLQGLGHGLYARSVQSVRTGYSPLKRRACLDVLGELAMDSRSARSA